MKNKDGGAMAVIHGYYNGAVYVPLEIEHASVAFEEVWIIIDDELIGGCGKYLSNI